MAVFQFRAKSNLNSEVQKGFTFNVNSKFSSSPLESEWLNALKALGIKNMNFCSNRSSWEITKL